MKRLFGSILLISMVVLTGCASVPMAPKEEDAKMKKFSLPAQNQSGVYLYRNTFVGQALKKSLYIDGQFVGETANKVYFYKTVKPGTHKISTESEFSDNDITLKTQGGKNYFVEQFIKMGVFVGGAALKEVSEAEGKKQVMQCGLAQ